MRVLRTLLLLIAVMAHGFAHGADAGDTQQADGIWSTFAGAEDEIQGQILELRDELIPAHISFLSALEKAVAELPSLAGDAERGAMAWTRVEYLLETSFRLLDGTSEYAAFLKTTEPLKPVIAPPPPTAALDAPEDPEPSPDGGLEFVDVDGRALAVVPGENGPALVDPETGLPPENLDGVVAFPRDAAGRPERSFIPLIRARAAWLRAMTLERLGRTAEAGTEAAGLGLIRDWAVLGPIDSLPEDGSFINYGLDEIYAGLDAARLYSGKSGPVRWTPFSSVDPLGRVVPGARFRGEGLQSAYYLTLVHSAADQPAVLRFGSTAPAAVCVNHLVVNHARPGGLPDPDQEAVNVWMRRGWNIVLIRTSSASEDWAFAVRLTATDGSPFPGYVAAPTAENLAEVLTTARKASVRSLLERFYGPGPAPESGGLSVMSAWLERHPDDARANFYLGSFLVARRMMEGPERFDRELIFRRAIDLSRRDPFFTLIAARSIDSGVEGPDREENLRLVLLRSVADRGSAAALADIGRLYLDVMRQPRRANEYAEMALSVNPMSLRAGALDYDVAIDMGWDPVAKTLLDRLVNRHPSSSAARLRLGRAALAGGRHRQALTEFHAILAVDAANREALDGAVLAMGMLGQTSAAVDLLLGHIERFPYDFAVRLKLAELYRVLGRDADAARVVEAALETAPDDPAALAMQGDLRRESYAETAGPDALPAESFHQEIDLSPSPSPPANGWEYLYFQVEDRMEQSGAIQRSVSFAVRIYSARAARMLRHLGLWLDDDLEQSAIKRLDVIEPDGARRRFTPPGGTGRQNEPLNLYLPPLQPGMAFEVEVAIRREPAPFLGDYFGHIAPLAQLAPVRLSRYMFVAPKERRVFFKPVNGAPEAMVVPSSDGRTVTRIWEMSNLPAFIPEPYSPGTGDLAPSVQVSSFGDWDEFARWYWRLIGVQYHSPPELRNLARRMADDGGAPMVKLDRAASWIARNIGQRSWEYGPYAFRPINARSILSRLSAEGKDRTLLLCLLAREYGLDAWPVLARLRGGRHDPLGSSDLSLPLLDHFNHSLTLVHAGPGGDVFMDASNPYRPPAVMPSQLFGSPGLAVSPSGARKIVIPDGGASACEWREEADMIVDADGSVLWEEKLVALGTAAENLRALFPAGSDTGDAWSAFLRSRGADPSTATGEFRDADGGPSRADWEGRARLRRLAAMDGDRVILTVPAMPGSAERPGGGLEYPLSLEDIARRGERDQDVLLPHGFRVARRLSIRYPPEWRLVNPSQAFSRDYPFGTLSVAGGNGRGELIIDFSVEVPGHRVAAGDFAAFREMAAIMERWICPELVWERP